jgi:hypothetical protein
MFSSNIPLQIICYQSFLKYNEHSHVTDITDTSQSFKAPSLSYLLSLAPIQLELLKAFTSSYTISHELCQFQPPSRTEPRTSMQRIILGLHNIQFPKSSPVRVVLGFDVLTAITIKSCIFWDIEPTSPLLIYLHLQVVIIT